MSRQGYVFRLTGNTDLDAPLVISIYKHKSHRVIRLSRTTWSHIFPDIYAFRVVRFERGSTLFLCADSEWPEQSPESYVWRFDPRHPRPRLQIRATNAETTGLRRGVVREQCIAGWVEDPPPGAKFSAEIVRRWSYSVRHRRFVPGEWVVRRSK